MQINAARSDSTLTLSPEGRLDNHSSPELKDTVDNSLEGVTSLVLDLSMVDYVSSAGLRTLLSVHKQMSERGGMKVTNVKEGVMEILKMTGFVNVLSIE